MHPIFDDTKFVCPESGVLLGILVKAFRLDHAGALDDPARFLGSDASAGRNARRYFKGERVPDETRKIICRRVVDVALSHGLLKGFGLPRLEKDPPPVAEFLCEVLYGWLIWWDNVVVRESAGWPHLPRHLAGFVIGRQVALDLAIRAAALLHLCGAGKADRVMICPPHPNAGKAVLEQLMEHSRTRFTRDELARRLDVERSTVDEWQDRTMVPGDDSLKRLSELFATPDRNATQVFRWLCVQYGLIYLGRRLVEGVGQHWTAELIEMFYGILVWALEFHTHSRLPPPVFLLKQVHAMRTGICEPGSRYIFKNFRDNVELPVEQQFWIDDLKEAQQCRVRERLHYCFSTIGDWPSFVRKFDADPANAEFPAEDRPFARIGLMLYHMSPSLQAACPPSDRDRASRPPLSGCTMNRADFEWEKSQAWNLMQANRFDEAAGIFAKLVAAAPNDAEIRCYWSRCLSRGSQRDYSAAADQLKEAIRLKPGWDFPVGEMARMHLDRGLADMAAYWLDEAPQAVVNASAECLFMRALAFSRLGRLSEALEASRASFAIDPQHGDAWDLAAECAFRLNDPVNGRRFAKQAAHLGVLTTFRNSKVGEET